MSVFSRKDTATVPGRAYVVPAGTHAAFGNENNVSADSTIRCEVHLVAISVSDGKPFVQPMQKLLLRLPNWVLILFHHAGTNDELADQLPERIELDVAIGTTTRAIVDLDIEAVKRDLAPYKELAVEEWKHTDERVGPGAQLVQAARLRRQSHPQRAHRVQSAAGELAEAFRPDGRLATEAVVDATSRSRKFVAPPTSWPTVISSIPTSISAPEPQRSPPCRCTPNKSDPARSMSPTSTHS